MEGVALHGEAFKIKVAPVDPADAFRGRYIDLVFEPIAVPVAEPNRYQTGGRVYALLTKDPDGYARVQHIDHEKPASSLSYLEVSVSYIIDSPDERTVYLSWPFDRYYLPEKRARAVDERYAVSLSNEGSEVYAIIRVLDGLGMLTDVVLDGISVSDNP